MDAPQRKARLFFETKPQPHNVTFDDGKDWRRNLPWVRYVGAHWSYADPDVIRLEIDEWEVVLSGHNLAPLYAAVEEQALASVRAHPEWEHEAVREPDTFATRIRFVRLSAFPASRKRKQPRQSDLDLD
jgi:hypothetical protein